MAFFNESNKEQGKFFTDKYRDEYNENLNLNQGRNYGNTGDYTSSRTREDVYNNTFNTNLLDTFGQKYPTFNSPEARSVLSELASPINSATNFYNSRLGMTPGTITPEVQNVLNTLAGVSDEALSQQLATTRGDFFRAADSAGQLGFEETYRRNRLERDNAVAELLYNLQQSDIQTQLGAAEGLTNQQGQKTNLLSLLLGEQTGSQTGETGETFDRSQSLKDTQEQTDKWIDIFNQAIEKGYSRQQIQETIAGITEGITEEDRAIIDDIFKILNGLSYDRNDDHPENIPNPNQSNYGGGLVDTTIQLYNDIKELIKGNG
jgi:hypothetical protein